MSDEHFTQINTVKVGNSLQVVGLTDIGRVFLTSLSLDDMDIHNGEQPYCIPDWVQILAPDFDLD